MGGISPDVATLHPGYGARRNRYLTQSWGEYSMPRSDRLGRRC